MNKIKSLADLVRELNSCSLDSSCYLDTLKRMELNTSELEQFYSWSEDNYTRNSVYENELFELIVVCFEKGQKSPIHDYHSNEAWITVLSGKMREEKFRLHPQVKKLEKLSSVNLLPGDFTFISGQVGIHRYYNVYETRSVCLCLYSKPVKTWRVYDESTSEFKLVDTWYNQRPESYLEPIKL
ncbi:cysteine dioxygenase [Luteibaculum oceani]|uniref:Cysteine dioxygenase n=1 Tax=Luteibaculum oceani TaxID=1294296 RepID=A0A5C6VIS6_9FLAO|nr:cysteine dioxygenase family protein [Luteibaculum oceani]TXC85333.1 hypothetical protein FRX97_01535 [Luteibaculum oceani]